MGPGRARYRLDRLPAPLPGFPTGITFDPVARISGPLLRERVHVPRTATLSLPEYSPAG